MENEKQMKSEQALVKKVSDIANVLAAAGVGFTDYITQSIIGSFLYYGYGLALHTVCSHTYSFLVGVAMLATQMIFAHWWFRHFRRGPLETIWHRLTWIGAKR